MNTLPCIQMNAHCVETCVKLSKSRNLAVTSNQTRNFRPQFLVKPRNFCLHQDHPGIYQKLADSNQELNPEDPAPEYFFFPHQINTYIMIT